MGGFPGAGICFSAWKSSHHASAEGRISRRGHLLFRLGLVYEDDGHDAEYRGSDGTVAEDEGKDGHRGFRSLGQCACS